MSGSDSDMPGLVDASDSEEESLRHKARSNEEAAKMWFKRLMKGKNAEKQERVVKVYMLSPFLFGQKFHQPEKWLNWAKCAGLLLSSCYTEARVEALQQEEMENIELLEKVFDVLISHLKDASCLCVIMNLVETCDKVDMWEKAVKAYDKFIDNQSMFKTIKKELPGRNRKVKFSFLFACRQYSNHVVNLTFLGKDMLEKFEEEYRADEKKSKDTKNLGNLAFSMGKFKGAIAHYTKGIAVSPYSHILYGNRAQAYLKTQQYREALSDSKRARILKPEWPKGHYRYAQSLYEMNFKDKAKEANTQALTMCKSLGAPEADIKDLETQQERFNNPTVELKDTDVQKKEEDGNDSESDVPDLTDPSSGEEYSSDSETDELPPALVSLTTSDDSLSEGSADDGEQSDAPELVSEEEDDPETKEYIEKVKQRCLNYKQPKEPEMSQSILDEDKARREEERKKKEKKKKKKEEEQKKKEESRRKKRTKRGDKNKTENQDGANPPMQQPPKSPEDVLRDDFQFLQKQGTTALMDERSRHALHDFQKCLEMVHDHGSKTFLLEEIDLALLKYSYATACIETGTYKEILEGIDMYNSILKDHPSCRFVLAYLGLGKAHIKLNRYSEALDPLGKGLEMSTKVSMQSLTWPGTPLKINNSNRANIQKEFENLIQLCRNPPQPDAICRYKNCDDHKIHIYFSDPDFKGIVRALCLDKCQTDFHINCWKSLKTELSQSDKDFIKMACFTPDCEGVLTEVQFFDEDGLKKKELMIEEEDLNRIKESRHGGKGKKMNPSSLSQEVNSKKKPSKKELRKQKRQDLSKKLEDVQEGSTSAKVSPRESKDLNSDNSIMQELEMLEKKAEHIHKTSKPSSATSTPRQEENKLDFAGKLPAQGSGTVTPPVGDVKLTMLKREDEDEREEITYKAFKQQKHKQKKKKEKKVMSLDEFHETSTTMSADVPDPDIDGTVDRQMPTKSLTIGGLEDIDDFEVCSVSSSNYSETLDMDRPFQPPEHLRDQIEAFENSRTTAKYASAAEAVKANIGGVVGGNQKPKDEDYIPPELIPIREFMYSFFEETLKVSGPIHIEDERITGEIRNFPDEAVYLIKKAGHLRDFLLKSFKFAVIGDYVCLMRDAVHAREMWEKDRQRLGLSVGVNSMRGSLAELAQSALRDRAMSPRTLDSYSKADLTDLSAADFPSLYDAKSVEVSNSNEAVQNVYGDPVTLSSIATCVGSTSVVTPNGENLERGRNSPALISKGNNNIENEMLKKPESDSESDTKRQKNIQGGPQNISGNAKSTETGNELSSIADEFRRKVHSLVGELRDKGTCSKDPSSENDGKDSEVKKPAFIAEMKIADADARSRSLSPSVLARGTKTPEFHISISNKAKNINISQNAIAQNSEPNRSLTPKDLPGGMRQVSGHSSSLPATPSHMSSWPNYLDGVPHEAKALNNGGQMEAVGPPGLKIKPIGSEKKMKKDAQNGGTFQRAVGSLNTGGRSMAEVGHSPENPAFPVTTSTLSEFSPFQGSSDSPNLFLPSRRGDRESPDVPGRNVGPPQREKMITSRESKIAALVGSSGFDTDPLKIVSSILGDDANEEENAPKTQENPPLAIYPRNYNMEPPIVHPLAQSPKLNQQPTTPIHQLPRPPGGYVSMHPPLKHGTLQGIGSTAAESARGSTGISGPKVAEVAVQTEPWEEYEGLRQEHVLLETTCQELKDKYKQLQNSNSADMKRLQEKVEELEEEMKNVNDENKKLTKSHENEVKKWAQEKKGYLEELKALKQQIATLKLSEQEFIEQISARDQKVLELYQQINSDRDKSNTDRLKTHEQLEVLSSQVNKERTRAQLAEVQVLRVKQEVGTDFLSRSLRDAQLYLTYLGKGIQKLQDEHHPVPPPLQTSYEQWEAMVKKLQELINQSLNEFQEQIKMVESGRELASLPELQIPKPPPAPPMMPGMNLTPGMLSQMGGPPSMYPPLVPPSRPIARPPNLTATAAAAPQTVTPGFPTPSLGSASLGSFPQQPQLPPGLQQGQQVAPLTATTTTPPPLGLPPARPVPNLPGAVPPVGTVPQAPQRPIGSGTPRNSFEKIMLTLTSMFPQISRTEITQKIQDLRESRGGSLSGMALEEIIHSTASMILQNQGKPMPNQMSRPTLPPGFSYGNQGNSSSSSSVVSNIPQVSPSLPTLGSEDNSQELFEEEVDPCIICHEELTPATTARLDCKHRFHRTCISKWFREQSTCPTCRVHALLPEDFPNLK
ncbi:E3 ubiquitin-protein ligase TTC3 [Lingula anatina]|uniref:RING-type E3 ubiquitin transferase n=1 Tax=Lingula anatina TaxID=7574 RepID=A0A2R2MIF4_LINAN|nr:E3 ubiquitin-protein ligase TTC3 [Lingula anatina]|eukprot:XP_023929974.1 E3 ubiquitin-protein ligase TTC3 [Lingula anatina]